MSTENLVFVPTHIKIISFVVLGFAICFSAGLTLFYILQDDAQSDFVLASLSIFQATTSAAAIALVIFYSRKSLGRSSLLKETSRWLTKELPESLEIIDLPFNPDPNTWNVNVKAADVKASKVKIEHLRGSSVAHYYVTAFGVNIFFRITLNSHRFIVLYNIPVISEEMLEKVKSATEIVERGAKLLDYDVNYTAVNDRVQLYFIKDVGKGFLTDSTERLFWSQDIATMTRSMILMLNGANLINKNT